MPMRKVASSRENMWHSEEAGRLTVIWRGICRRGRERRGEQIWMTKVGVATLGWPSQQELVVSENSTRRVRRHNMMEDAAQW